MKQSRLMSFAESLINIVVGLGVAMAANAIILPMLGFPITFGQNAILAAFMTIVSIARSYALRRLFEALHIRRPLTPGMAAVIAERWRQIDAEGWTPEHDAAHSPGILARAGAAYLLGTKRIVVVDYEDGGEAQIEVSGRMIWPWEFEWWKPDGDRRNAVKGGALAIAELDRADYVRKRGAL